MKNKGSKGSGNNRIDAEAPDRDEIIGLLESHGRPLQRKDIVQRLNVESSDSREILRRRLIAMERDGQLVKNRRNAYGLTKKMDLIAGRISAHPDGFGFVMPDDGESDLYLSPRQMRTVLHGDRVLASVVGIDARGRREGAVNEILERAHSRVVGHYVEESGIALVVPDDNRINQDVLIPLQDTAGARPGQVVVAEITQQPRERKPPVGRIVEILGKSGAPGMATEIAIRNFDLPHEWPEGVEEEAAAFGDSVPEEMKQGRRDLRDLPLVTIDGADARDFDDAVYAQRRKNGWRLVVAIADVASYVTPGSALEHEAERRATSVYFPGRVIPMLPEALSNGLCSLRPDEDRLCVVCDMSINDAGKVTRARFDKAVMRSQARLTYEQVWEWIVSGKPEIRENSADVSASLKDLYGLYRALRKARTRRGAIDFESTDVQFSFDERGAVSDIRPYERNDAHKLIEECMITANVEAARLLLRQQIPGPFRAHEPPPPDKLESLDQFLRGLGIKVPWRGRPTPRDFETVVQQIKGREDRPLIMAVLLRAQSLATYQPGNSGHFGLALEAYAHFTSPIRRYPDLLVHRAIHHVVSKKKRGAYPLGMDRMSRLCEQCSHRSRRAEEAERDVNDRLKAYFMEQHIGDEFDGQVTGVTSFGLFVELQRNRVSGLVHITSLPNDYYHFDPVVHRLTGERTGRQFQLAQKVRVKVMAVNVDDRKIDFELVR
ncbi:MAG: ribonuclease R [Xanthomonadales bacterium]|nr:ribonuclease R [Gammaproteobacteria bacterium]MBT8050003.1 ribonuclease R [Gammaproteobacteria bacterium]MBT8056150.1 ribonuclease R [Gammaproteobacteria bacterium]NNJ79392.1 ribonuclease R [Xanthomonadales bacterium]NNL04985.1 ribonuclease R [Xanthomonadales bacterium]